MSFANFVFYPLVIGTIVAVIIEQIFRARGDAENPEDVRRVAISMGVRKYLYRQAWIFNVIWFIGYFILMFTVGRQQPQAMPDMIWQGEFMEKFIQNKRENHYKHLGKNVTEVLVQFENEDPAWIPYPTLAAIESKFVERR